MIGLIVLLSCSVEAVNTVNCLRYFQFGENTWAETGKCHFLRKSVLKATEIPKNLWKPENQEKCGGNPEKADFS